MTAIEEQRQWWNSGVFYAIYPRSWNDSNGDGVGDIRGVIERLDHLQWLGIAGVWLNPIMPSPNCDWGYDVAEYCDVHPELGTLADVDELIAQAAKRDIHVIFDLVPNHTSDQHPWFQKALEGRDSPYREFYVFADGKADGSPPNNWRSTFGGQAWTREPSGDQYYLHNFLPSQPDLNWWNEEVRNRFDSILRFWFDRGVSGLRIDVCHGIIKDRELRDDPPATLADHPRVQRHGLRQVYSLNRPEVHEVLRRWRALADGYDDRKVLFGETYVFHVEELIPYYGNGDDELHLAFNAVFLHSPFELNPLRLIVEQIEAMIPEHAWPVWAGSTHDARRLATRWAEGDERKVRLALMMLLTLRGTPFIYYGDEIGMQDGAVAYEQLRDPVSIRTGDPKRGRDGCRTPMQWAPSPDAGFTEQGVTPWLPVGDSSQANVRDQCGEQSSVLHFVRDLIELRRLNPDLALGGYEAITMPDGVWAWRRGEHFVVVLNFTNVDKSIRDLNGEILAATERDLNGQTIASELSLGPYAGVVLKTD